VLVDRVRQALAGRHDVVEKPMVGGRSFMVGGRMVLGVAGDDLMVKLAGADYDAALRERNVRPMTLGGRALKHYLLVAGAAVASDADLGKWIARAIAPESEAR
jgi:hypothetical protein